MKQGPPEKSEAEKLVEAMLKEQDEDAKEKIPAPAPTEVLSPDKIALVEVEPKKTSKDREKPGDVYTIGERIEGAKKWLTNNQKQIAGIEKFKSENADLLENVIYKSPIRQDLDDVMVLTTVDFNSFSENEKKYENNPTEKVKEGNILVPISTYMGAQLQELSNNGKNGVKYGDLIEATINATNKDIEIYEQNITHLESIIK